LTGGRGDFQDRSRKKKPIPRKCEVISFLASSGTPFAEEIFARPIMEKAGKQKSTMMPYEHF